MTRQIVTDPAAGRRSARSAVPLPAELRQQRCEVARYALAEGLPLNLDAITVVLAAKQFESSTDGRPVTRWTSTHLMGFLWGTVVDWCRTSDVAVPAATAESLWTYLTFLFERGELASGSSRLADLREVMVEHTNLSRAGRAAHPSSRAGRAPVLPLRDGRRKVAGPTT